MLKNSNVHRIIIVILVIASFAGCGEKRTVDPISRVKVPPTYSQVLSIQNKRPNSINILPVPGSNVSYLEVMPDETKKVDFKVQRYVLLDYSGAPINYHWTVEINEQNPYLQMKNGDAQIQIETSKGKVPYRIKIGDCWSKNKPPTKPHDLAIEEEGPIFGVPAISLCE